MLLTRDLFQECRFVVAVRDDLEALELAEWDAEEQEFANEAQAVVGAPPEMSLETIGLLTRARRALDADPDNAALSAAIDSLRQAVQRGDSAAVATDSEALLDILYELEE